MRTIRYFGAVCLLSLAALAPSLASAGDDVNPLEHAKALSRAFRQAAEDVKPAVVTIIARYQMRNGQGRSLQELLQDPQFRQLFPDQLPFEQPERPEQLFRDDVAVNVGSGVIIDQQGLILTNNHVIENASEVLVRMADGSESIATDIRTDPLSDVAILRAPRESQVPAARIGDSSQLEIGDWVIAIGSPFELEATVSAGIISAKERAIARVQGRLLQTDAAINPGNSGGPLVNLAGEVVGINTAIATSSGGYQGVGFAIPINQAKWIAGELLDHGQVRRAWLGILIGELTADAARQMQLQARSGVWVTDVVPNSPASAAGLQRDDVIVDFGGVAVRSPVELLEAVEQRPIGSKHRVQVMRAGKQVTVEVTVASRPADLTPRGAGPAERNE